MYMSTNTAKIINSNPSPIICVKIRLFDLVPHWTQISNYKVNSCMLYRSLILKI